MTKWGTALLAVCAFALHGCAKVAVDCDYTIRTVEEEVKNGKDEFQLSSDIRVFAHLLDAQEWEVASYEDALQGIVTSKTTGAKAAPDFIGAEGEKGFYSFNFTEIPVMLVACHTVYPAYGWRNSGVVANLDRMDIPVVFRIWKYESENEGDILKEDEVLDNDKGWKMVYISTWVEPEGPGTSGCVRMQ